MHFFLDKELQPEIAIGNIAPGTEALARSASMSPRVAHHVSHLHRPRGEFSFWPDGDTGLESRSVMPIERRISCRLVGVACGDYREHRNMTKSVRRRRKADVFQTKIGNPVVVKIERNRVIGSDELMGRTLPLPPRSPPARMS
jgi:hypothetical protein